MKTSNIDYNKFYSKSDWKGGLYITKYHLKIYLKILKKYFGRKFKKVIDIGCGTGNITQAFGLFNYSCTGIDFSDIAIKKANIKYPNQHFICDNALLLANNSFYDLIFAKGFSQLNTDDLKTIYEIIDTWKRHLSLNGTICIVGHTNFSGKSPTGWLYHTKKQLEEICQHDIDNYSLIYIHRLIRPFVFLMPNINFLFKLVSYISEKIVILTKKPTDWILIIK